MHLRPAAERKLRLTGRRLVATTAAVAVLSAALAAGLARADVGVSLSSAGALNVSVFSKPLEATDGDHFIVINPFRDGSRNGFIVFFVAPSFGGPALLTSDPDCFNNPLAADVVCSNGLRSSVVVTGGRGADRVLVFSEPIDNRINPVCVDSAAIAGIYQIDLGPGADRLDHGVESNECTSGMRSDSQFNARFHATGGAGADVLNGGAGPDRLSGGTGADALAGAGGNDIFPAGGDSDTMGGGAGFDTVTYVGSLVPVAVTIGSGADDGPVPGTDNVGEDVEIAVGGSSNDALIGNGRDNTLTGAAGRDTLRGEGGQDRLEGGPGNDSLGGGDAFDVLLGEDNDDTLVGGAARDSIIGGNGTDTIDARDGAFDDIVCGPGIDFATGDLADFLSGGPKFFVRNANGLDCENVDTLAIDDAPPGRAVGRSLRRAADGRARVGVACPRSARVACRGTLTVRLGRPNGRVLSRASYAARVGRTTAVQLRLGPARRGTRVFLHTVERGVSKKGPRRSMRLLLVR